MTRDIDDKRLELIPLLNSLKIDYEFIDTPYVLLDESIEHVRDYLKSYEQITSLSEIEEDYNKYLIDFFNNLVSKKVYIYHFEKFIAPNLSKLMTFNCACILRLYFEV